MSLRIVPRGSLIIASLLLLSVFIKVNLYLMRPRLALKSSSKLRGLALVVLMFQLKKFIILLRLRCIRAPIVRKSSRAISGIRFCLKGCRS